jgi:hypothetical protein
MNWLTKLFGDRPNGPPPRPDPLDDLIQLADEQSAEALAAVNESRIRRGERPIEPTWEQLFRREPSRVRR